MKNKYLYLALAATLLFSLGSCKKSEQTCRLGKSYLTDGSNTPIANTFYYSSNGELIKVAYSNKTTDSLAYNADSLHIWTFNENAVLTTMLSGVLNSQGYLVAGVISTLDGAGNVTGTQTFTNTYNAEGNLTQSATGNTTTTINYTDGNSTDGSITVDSSQTVRYNFYHNRTENKTGLNETEGTYTPYLGKPSKTLLDSLHVITATDTVRVKFTYELDNNGYVTKTTKTTLSGNVNTRYFTYSYINCSE